MKRAISLVSEGVILTTDADAEVPENWIEANLRAIEAGADAVCGMAVIDPLEALLIPPHLHDDDAREVAYGRLLDEIESMILPDHADPWPRHTEDSGASIAITTSMLRNVGGVPFLPSGEDRALIEMLRLMDARVRHDPQISVVVSGRIEGRAHGGMADTIRRRIVRQDEFVDDRIQPAWAALHRQQDETALQPFMAQPNRVASSSISKTSCDRSECGRGRGCRAVFRPGVVPGGTSIPAFVTTASAFCRLTAGNGNRPRHSSPSVASICPDCGLAGGGWNEHGRDATVAF